MARINVNLNEVEEFSGTPHPDGLLHIRVKEAKLTEAKREGAYPYVNCQLLPVGTENRSSVWLKLSLHPNAQWNTKQFLEALKVRWNSDGSYDSDELPGKECKVTVSTREYNGKPSNEVGPPYFQV